MASPAVGVKRSFMTMAHDMDAQTSLQTTPESSSSDSDRRASQRLRRTFSGHGKGAIATLPLLALHFLLRV